MQKYWLTGTVPSCGYPSMGRNFMSSIKNVAFSRGKKLSQLTLGNTSIFSSHFLSVIRSPPLQVQGVCVADVWCSVGRGPAVLGVRGW
jgi:hypothetical protein